jgi:protein-tyrosine phosphatase
MYDIHSHILFDVDDGSQSFEESQEMLHAARAVGIDEIVCTPHFNSLSFNRKRIEENFEVLQAFAEQQGVPMLLGFEVHWKILLETGVEIAPEFCIDGTDMLLLEFSYSLLPPNWQRLITKLQSMGLRVIIAHPERYMPIQKNTKIAKEMRDMGCLLQLSANFAGLGAFSTIKKTALTLIDEGLVDYVASDAHCPADYQEYPKAISLWRKKRPL